MFKWPFIQHRQKAAGVRQNKATSFVWANHSRYLFAVIFLAGAIFFYFKITAPGVFPIQHVEVVDLQEHVNRQALKSTVMPELQNGFFHVNVKEIQQEVDQLPWVHRAVVRRVWPNTVVIKIQEQHPIALWNDHHLLTAQGQLFAPDTATLPSNLPHLTGSQGEQRHAAHLYRVMQAQLKTLGLAITKFTLTPRHDVLLQINQQFSLDLGEEGQQQRLEEFIQVYPEVFASKLAELESVNMQYNHGMAVEWRNNA
jgi:cell division protein FtsQ